MPRPTIARIDLDALAHNVAIVRRLVGQRKICAVVKANAYGHGARMVCSAANAAGVDMFAVALTEEAVDLRAAGFRQPIILLTAVPTEDIKSILENDITACVSDEGFGRALSAQAVRHGLQAQAHANVDTGMHVGGLDWETAVPAIMSLSRLPGLRLTGIFSHFPCADADDLSFSREQIRRLKSVILELKDGGMQLPFVHMASSNAVLRLPEAYFDGVRPGLMLYGLCSRPELRSFAGLRPVLTLRTRISHCKPLARGEQVSYGHTFAAHRATVLATLPIGYHDGFIRQFSNVGKVLVRGKRAPVVGTVCMDQIAIDVTDVPNAQVGDDVIVYGRQGDECITVEEMAARVSRIPYELTCAVGQRVPREYVRNGAVVPEAAPAG